MLSKEAGSKQETALGECLFRYACRVMIIFHGASAHVKSRFARHVLSLRKFSSII